MFDCFLKLFKVKAKHVFDTLEVLILLWPPRHTLATFNSYHSDVEKNHFRG